MTLFDVEYGWDRKHEDLKSAKPKPVRHSKLLTKVKYIDHGTAVLGVLGADAHNAGLLTHA